MFHLMEARLVCHNILSTGCQCCSLGIVYLLDGDERLNMFTTATSRTHGSLDVVCLEAGHVNVAASACVSAGRG